MMQLCQSRQCAVVVCSFCSVLVFNAEVFCFKSGNNWDYLHRLSEPHLFDTDHLLYPNPVTMEELVHEKTAKRQKLNEKIENIFLDMMVDLFRYGLMLICKT